MFVKQLVHKCTNCHCASLTTHDDYSVVSWECTSDTAPRLWNSLPTDITSARTLPVLKKHLKTHLFNVSYNL